MANTNISASNTKRLGAMDALYITGFKQTTIVLLVLFAIFLLTLVIMYIVNRVKASKLQQVVLNKDVVTLDNAKEVPYTVNASNLSLATAGQEFSYNFWIYLGPQYQSTANHKLILTRGLLPDTKNGNVDYNCNPIFFMDKGTNRLYVALSTNLVTATSVSLSDILQKDVNGRYTSGFIVTYIDYVPLQRWVNITLTVKDSAAYLFMDADMYSAVTVSDVVTSDTLKRPIIRGGNGDVTIGSRSNTTNGFVALSSYFNYALTQDEIKKLYSRGPYPKSILSFFGLGSYSLRSPVYRVDS